MLTRLTMCLTPALIVLVAGAARGEPQMRTAELIGVPIRAITYGNSHGIIARSPEGRDGMFYIGYYSTTGGELVGYHADSGEHVRLRLGSSGGYGGCVGSDGALYLGGVGPGDLYRYDPATGELQDLGGSQFGASYIWATAASPDGKVYCACYPTCSVIEYDIASGEMRDLGTLNPERKYARSICVDDSGKVWAGVGIGAQLFVIDPATGERRQVLPEQYLGNSSCYDLQVSGRYVFASVLQDAGLLVFDAESEEVVRRVPTPEDTVWWMNCHGAPAGEAYFFAIPDGDLYHYDVEADELTLLAEHLGQCEQVVDGRFVHGIDDQEYFLYDLETGEHVEKRELAEARDGMRVQTLAGDASGNIFGSTYINQHMFGYRPDTGRITDLGKVIRVGGQVDSMHAGRDGRIYMGAYVRATLSIFDPSLPWRPGMSRDSNPRELGEIGHGQYRTRAIALGPDDRIWVGSIPSYNSGPTGAFSVWDPESGEHRSWLDLVPGGAVGAIGVGERYLYCAGGGRFFVWDPVAEAKALELEMAVSSLAVAPDGTVVISAGDEIALFDPESLEVTQTTTSPIGAMTSMICAPDGNIYGVSDAAVAMVEPGTWQATKIADEGGTLLAADADSTLYFARGAQLWRLRVAEMIERGGQ